MEKVHLQHLMEAQKSVLAWTVQPWISSSLVKLEYETGGVFQGFGKGRKCYLP